MTGVESPVTQVYAIPASRSFFISQKLLYPPLGQQYYYRWRRDCIVSPERRRNDAHFTEAFQYVLDTVFEECHLIDSLHVY